MVYQGLVGKGDAVFGGRRQAERHVVVGHVVEFVVSRHDVGQQFLSEEERVARQAVEEQAYQAGVGQSGIVVGVGAIVAEGAGMAGAEQLVSDGLELRAELVGQPAVVLVGDGDVVARGAAHGGEEVAVHAQGGSVAEYFQLGIASCVV